MEGVAVQRQHLYRLAYRIDDPVVTHSSEGIQRALGQAIMSPIGGAEYFDQQIGSAFDTPTRANGARFGKQYHDVRLHGIGALDEDIEWCGDDLPPQRLDHRN